jgi:uncharacterized protein (DUF2147 family)
MIAVIKRAALPLAITLMSAASPAYAAGSPFGIWIDHTGRGAVEITDCNSKLCGRLVWFKDPKHVKDGCNFQIIGDVRPVGGNKWDEGWIIDPDKDPDKKYDVEITPQGDQKLKVMGYAGMKFLNETMIWTRAPADLKKCTEDLARANDTAPAQEPSKEAPAASPAPVAPPVPEATRPEKPEKSARNGKQKECKMDLSFAVVTFPCPE